MLGVHRQLGPSVTRVRSAKLDSWKMENIEILAATGNRIANDYWERSVPASVRKPDLNASMDDVRRKVNDKYIKKLYAPSNQPSPIQEFVEARKNEQVTAGTFSASKLGNTYDRFL